MSRTSRKIGFWSVFGLVTGSQIGTGVFMLPASLAPYGFLGLVGWIISGLGAVSLALVFARLCSWYPKTGGPHVYVKEAFGTSAAFFVGWTYWVISWVSTTVVVVASIGYLTPLIGSHSQMVHLTLEITLLFLIMFLNLRGVKVAGHAEFFLAALKIVPLIVMPLAALFFFNKDNFAMDAGVMNNPLSHNLSAVALLAFWGFIGVEMATTPAGSIENPSKTIPRAIIIGTLCVAILYFINSLGIMGVIPGKDLMLSKAPYVDAVRHMWGGNWHLVISLIASIVCIGTLNAWTLSSGQIALGLAQDGLMPKFFAQKNRNDAPFYGLLVSFIGIVPLLILTSNENLVHQMTMIIDFSVLSFLFVYMGSCLAFLKLRHHHKEKVSFFSLGYGLVAFLFCAWIICEMPWKTIFVASLFTFSGLPLYMCRYKKLFKKS